MMKMTDEGLVVGFVGEEKPKAEEKTPQPEAETPKEAKKTTRKKSAE